MLDVTAALLRPADRGEAAPTSSPTARPTAATPPRAPRRWPTRSASADLPPDLFEAFNVGRELTAGAGRRSVLRDAPRPVLRRQRVAGRPGRLPRPRGWRTGTRSRRWRSRSWRAAALALDLDADHFVPSLDRSISVMRANNYQRRAGARRAGRRPDADGRAHRLRQHHRAPRRPCARACSCATTPDAGTTCCRRRTGSSSTSATSSPSGRTTAGARRCTASCHRRPTPAAACAGGRSPGSSNRTGTPSSSACRRAATTTNPARYRPVTSGEHLMAKLMGPRLLRPSEPTPARTRG